MEFIDLSNHKLESLEPLSIDYRIFNTEGYLYKEANKVIKIFFDENDEKFENKIYTLKYLLKYKKYIEVPELVLPDAIVRVDGIIKGYNMPYIKSENLGIVLDNNRVSIEKKIELLKQIGLVLRKLEENRKKNYLELYINDLHENNIIVDSNGLIHFTDIDSCKTSSNFSNPSRYLMDFELAKYPGKFKSLYDNPCGGMYEINAQTDLYCYCTIILNLLSNGYLSLLTGKGFIDFLNYLDMIGINKELLSIFKTMKSNEETVNPDYLLDSIKEIYPKSTEFKEKTKKR